MNEKTIGWMVTGLGLISMAVGMHSLVEQWKTSVPIALGAAAIIAGRELVHGVTIASLKQTIANFEHKL